MHHRVDLAVVIFALLCGGAALLADSTRFAMPQPPPHAARVNVGKQSFYSGAIHIETGNDTAQLTPLGFRNFRFESRSVNSSRYHALWPLTAVHDSLPGWVTWLEYDIDTSSVLDSLPDLELPSPSDQGEPEPQPNPGEGNE